MTVMSKRVLLFAPCAFNLAETTRMVEIAKAVERHPSAGTAFDIHFISDGGGFEDLIGKHRFSLTRLEPRLSIEKIEHVNRVVRGEKLAPAFSGREMIQRVENEVACLRNLKPVAVITGSHPTIPVTCRVLETPLVWVIQSTWLPDFLRRGGGMTDRIEPAPLKAAADWSAMQVVNWCIRYGFLNPINRTAKHFGIPGYDSIFEFWRGDITLLAEPPEFSGAKLPPNHYFIGPLIPRDEFALPPELTAIPRDRPLIYFSMGSSGAPEIVARIVASFSGQPYRVIAPVAFQLRQVPGAAIPPNVSVTGWVPALEVNKMADLAVIHGGAGTVITAALAGKPVVGVGMQVEQVANIACLERLGFAIRVPKSRDPSKRVQAAIQRMLDNPHAKAEAAAFAEVIRHWDGPKIAADLLFDRFSNTRTPDAPSDASPGTPV
jgi:hypothetical protein